MLIFFYLGFKSKKIRVNLNLPIKSETKAETTEVLKLVDEDRKYVSQATIVRCVFSEACCRLVVVPEKTSLLFFFFFG